MNKMRRQNSSIDDEDESKQQLNNLNGRMRQQFSEQISQVSKGSRKRLNLIKKAKQTYQALDHTQLLKNPNFRSSFSIRQRTGNWVYNCFRCLNQDKSFIDVVQKQQKNLPGINEQLSRQLKDKILKLQIIQSSRMQLNPNVMHPFVKVHIVNIKNGSYFKTDQAPQNCIYRNQDITCIDDKGFQTCQNNLLLPFATNCCDFRQLGDSRGVWNQKFYINYTASQIMTPDTLFLFEILDFNHQALLYKDTDIYDKDNFFRVAWGFLRPVGIGKRDYFGKTKIQLYKYKFKTKKMDPQFNKSNVPTVYYEFIWNDHQKYQGFLTVQLNHCDKPKRRSIQDDQYPKNIFQIQRSDDKQLQNIFKTQKKNQQDDKIQIKHQILRFYRNKNRCQIPKEMIYKLESSKLGCFRVKFIGNYLYAACSQRKTTSVKVYNLQNGQKLMTLKGHRQIIYTLTTNSNDINNKQKYLITSGSDHFVRIWSIPDIFPEYIDEQQSNQYLVAQCLHTASVYSAVGIVNSSNQFIYTVTSCYDGYVRLWKSALFQKRVNNSQLISEYLINTGQRSDQKIYPTCSAINKSNQIFIGDSYGDIHIFTFQNFRLLPSNRVTNPQLMNDSILSIQLIQRHLFIQASDNIIRRYQLSGNKLIEDKSYSGGQYQSLLLNSKISPDLKYLLAPSENGKPIMWDVLTGQIIDLQHLNLNIKGPLVSCDWHPKYNLIALSGFVQNCPIFVYGNVLNQSEIKIFAV